MNRNPCDHSGVRSLHIRPVKRSSPVSGAKPIEQKHKEHQEMALTHGFKWKDKNLTDL